MSYHPGSDDAIGCEGPRVPCTAEYFLVRVTTTTITRVLASDAQEATRLVLEDEGTMVMRTVDALSVELDGWQGRLR